MRSTRLPSWIERLAGLDPPRGPAAVFLLDERELVLAQFLRQHGTAPALQAVRRRELPTDTFQDGALGGPLREPAQFLEIVAELREAAGMAGGSAVAAAALVLPDRWLRMTFVHLEDVPRNARQRQEALRFKLRKQVPFRVEELRVRGAETEAGRRESARFLIAFCVERVVAQVEDSFRRNGIHIGLVTNASLSAAHGVRQVYGEAGASLLFLARPDGYALLAHAGNGPAFYRYKNLDPALPAPVVTRLVVRELRMTKSFIEERELFGPEGALPEHALLLASESTRGSWSERLEAGLGLEARAFQSNGQNDQTFPSGPDSPDLPPELFLPMLGASLSVVA